MSARLAALLAHDFGTLRQSYDARDVILYALGVGAGAQDLSLVYERGLQVLPGLATVLCSPAPWYHDTGGLLRGDLVVHGSERLELLAPLPVTAQVFAKPRILSVQDKGEGRGALIIFTREICEERSGQPLARVTTRCFYRGDGGIGEHGVPPPALSPMPQRTPDLQLPMAISARAAAIYRLSGDDNPLHIDPLAAKSAGFDAPILHGLCTWGHVARLVAGHFPQERLAVMDARFTAPVVPGEVLTLALWQQPGGLIFRVLSGENPVLDHGELRFSPS